MLSCFGNGFSLLQHSFCRDKKGESAQYYLQCGSFDITLECYLQYNVMFICVLTELSINSEKNNKRSQAKKLSDPIWESIVFLILPLIKTFTSTFYYLVCVSDPLHARTYKHSHTQANTQIPFALKSNKHYRNFIDCLTNKMKCYSVTPNTFGTKTGLFRCIKYLVPVLISYSLITS